MAVTRFSAAHRPQFRPLTLVSLCVRDPKATDTSLKQSGLRLDAGVRMCACGLSVDLSPLTVNILISADTSRFKSIDAPCL